MTTGHEQQEPQQGRDEGPWGRSVPLPARASQPSGDSQSSAGASAVDRVDVDAIAGELVSSAAARGVDLTGEDGLLTALTRRVLQAALEAEMSTHLGYAKHAPAGRNRGNSRNGSTPKTVATEIGKVTVNGPRDRDGTFEPQIVRKH